MPFLLVSVVDEPWRFPDELGTEDVVRIADATGPLAVQSLDLGQVFSEADPLQLERCRLCMTPKLPIRCAPSPVFLVGPFRLRSRGKVVALTSLSFHMGASGSPWAVCPMESY